MIGTGVEVVYENGAVIASSFVTNLESSGVRSAPLLYEKITSAVKEIQSKKAKQLPRYVYPPEVLTFFPIGKLSQSGVDFKLERSEIMFISRLDSQKADDKTIYGGGFLLSEQATRKRQAAERQIIQKMPEVIEWGISPRERELIARLGNDGELEVHTA